MDLCLYFDGTDGTKLGNKNDWIPPKMTKISAKEHKSPKKIIEKIWIFAL